ncbi:Uncharacterized protein APZ42_014354 [Daphnia magna]|uniref:Uncharacterized protein n=1 Tax=Daphnia magna TaxID=35525 RepID=A0A162Q7P2_9CRUS|nr:Uncharacterized protein APZ42_014354 [Daphnia magna]
MLIGDIEFRFPNGQPI